MLQSMGLQRVEYNWVTEQEEKEWWEYESGREIDYKFNIMEVEQF